MPVFHGTSLPMDFWTPPRFLTSGCFRGLFGGSRSAEKIAGKMFLNRDMLQILGF